MEQNTGKWAIEVINNNVNELMEAGFTNAEMCISAHGNGSILYYDNSYSSFGWYVKKYPNGEIPLITIEQFREKYGKKESVMEKLDPLLKSESVNEIKSAMQGMPFVSEKESVGGRLYYLKLHINKNMEQGLCIPTEWVTEYNKHIEWLKNN